MKKRNLQQSLTLKKTTISAFTDKALKGGTASDIYTSRFVDLCYGVQTSYQGVCAIQCAPTTTEP